MDTVSAHWARTASVSVSPISDFWNGRHQHSFHQACGPNTQIWIHWTTKIVQKCRSRSTCRKVYNVNGPDIIVLVAWLWAKHHQNATDEWCERFRVCLHVKEQLLSIQFDCILYAHTFYVLVWWKLQVSLESLCYCIKYVKISLFLIFL